MKTTRRGFLGLIAAVAPAVGLAVAAVPVGPEVTWPVDPALTPNLSMTAQLTEMVRAGAMTRSEIVGNTHGNLTFSSSGTASTGTLIFNTGREVDPRYTYTFKVTDAQEARPMPDRSLVINKHEDQPVVIEPLTIRRSDEDPGWTTAPLLVTGNVLLSGNLTCTSTTYVQDLIGRDEPIPPGRYAVSSIKAY